MDNIINLGLTQALDTKDSGYVGSSASREGDSGFASLVEQHINTGKADNRDNIEAENHEPVGLTDNKTEQEDSAKPSDVAAKEANAANASLSQETQARSEQSAEVNKNSVDKDELPVESVAKERLNQDTTGENNQLNNLHTKSPELSSASKLLELVNQSELLIQRESSTGGSERVDELNHTDHELSALVLEKRAKQDKLFNQAQSNVVNELKQKSNDADIENIDDGQAVQRIQALSQHQQSIIAQHSQNAVDNKNIKTDSVNKISEIALENGLSIKEKLLVGSVDDLNQKHLVGQSSGTAAELAASNAVLSKIIKHNEVIEKQVPAQQVQPAIQDITDEAAVTEVGSVKQQASALTQASAELVSAISKANDEVKQTNTLDKQAKVAAEQSSSIRVNSTEALVDESSTFDVNRQIIANQTTPEKVQSAASSGSSQIPAENNNRAAGVNVASTQNNASSNSHQQNNTSQGNHQHTNSQEGQNTDTQLSSDQKVEQGSVVAESDKNSLKPEQQVNRSSAFQATLDAASQANERSIQQARASSEQQTYLDEVANQVTQDNLQVQKKQSAQLTETINIYRKDFSAQLKDKVMVMVSQKLQQVDIQLDPPELGNVQVRVNLQNEQAAVSFVVQNQQAKEALEQNINRLKDMLAGSGVDVGDANIEQRNQQSQGQLAQGESNSNQSAKQQEQEQSQLIEHEQQSYMVKGSAVGVDYYA